MVVKRWKFFIIVAFLSSFLWLILKGYSIAWTGFGDFVNPNGEFVRGKTLWDWMELFIIPVVLGFGLFWLNLSERNNEREIAKDRQNEAALQSYIDRMADLIMLGDLKNLKYEVVNVARLRTLTVLRVLDPKRAALVLKFLYDSWLIKGENSIIYLRDAQLSEVDLDLVYLNDVNLEHVNLSGASLQHAYLENANMKNAQLQGANFHSAKLSKANLYWTNLSGANLNYANLSEANLSWAILSGAKLNHANLSKANLENASLTRLDLRWVNLENANLENAYLKGAKITPKQLLTVASLKGAIMPDGSIHD